MNYEVWTMRFEVWTYFFHLSLPFKNINCAVGTVEHAIGTMKCEVWCYARAFVHEHAIKLNMFIKWAATWDFQQCGMWDQHRLRPPCAYAQSDKSLCLSLEYSMNIKLLTKHHLEFLSLHVRGGCIGSSESLHVKTPYCWKSHVAAQIMLSAVA